MRNRVVGVEADGEGWYTARAYWKRRKNRRERRRARRDPEVVPGYGFYRGWLT